MQLEGQRFRGIPSDSRIGSRRPAREQQLVVERLHLGDADQVIPLRKGRIIRQRPQHEEPSHPVTVIIVRLHVCREGLLRHLGKVAEQEHPGAANGKARLRAIGQIGRDRVPGLVCPESTDIPQTFSNFKRDRAPVVRAAPDAHTGTDKMATIDRLDRQERRRGQSVVDRVIDERSVPAKRATLRRAFKVGFARVTILNVGKLVAEGRHHLRQHHARVRFQTLSPAGISLRREIQQRQADTREIAREVVDRKIDQRLVGTGRILLPAIEPARAPLLEAELDVVEERIELVRVDVQRVDREVAGLRRLDLEHHPLLTGKQTPDEPRGGRVDLGDRVTPADTHDANGGRIERRLLRRGQRRNDDPRQNETIGIDEEEDSQQRLRLRVDDLDEVDPRERILLAESRKPVSAGHESEGGFEVEKALLALLENGVAHIDQELLRLSRDFDAIHADESS